jgi:uracil-DNA glycosylase
MEESLHSLLETIRSCRICADYLPLGANPVLRASTSARILIVGQAPGTKVHATGIPWNDPSGERLRAWMQVDKATFYDEKLIAIAPMGFCYPGKGKFGDLPPRPECAAHWRTRLHAQLPNIQLTLLIGQYAMQYYLGKRMKPTLGETVGAFEEYLPCYFPLVHPSPRNGIWLGKNPWFEADVIPAFRKVLEPLL